MTDTATTTLEIPGYREGTWVIDPAHSEVGFSIRHLMISKVKGKFEKFQATFVTPANPLPTRRGLPPTAPRSAPRVPLPRCRSWRTSTTGDRAPAPPAG